MSFTLESDRTLVAAFKRGDRSALASVFRGYAPLVARTCRVRGVPEHEVEALVQDVFIRAFAEKARLSWDGLRSYGAWLTTMTRNMVIDRARKERWMEFRAPEDMPALTADDDDPAAAQEEQELQTALQSFLGGLADDDAQLYAVRFEQGQSLAQAARTLGWSEIKVRKNDTAIRARLLEHLQKAGFLQDAQVRIGTSLLARKSA